MLNFVSIKWRGTIQKTTTQISQLLGSNVSLIFCQHVTRFAPALSESLKPAREKRRKRKIELSSWELLVNQTWTLWLLRFILTLKHSLNYTYFSFWKTSLQIRRNLKKSIAVHRESVLSYYSFFTGERCSFIPSANLWFDGFCAFESTREASRYLLFDDGKFFFRKYDSTKRFKENASFLFNKEVYSLVYFFILSYDLFT